MKIVLQLFGGFMLWIVRKAVVHRMLLGGQAICRPLSADEIDSRKGE